MTSNKLFLVNVLDSSFISSQSVSFFCPTQEFMLRLIKTEQRSLMLSGHSFSPKMTVKYVAYLFGSPSLILLMQQGEGLLSNAWSGFLLWEIDDAAVVTVN